MRRALDLARARRGLVWPNPPVGCVIVKNGLVAAEAATQPGGRPHAERKALDEAGPKAEGAT
ncbi:MAG: cytidine deaminase, partial [Pseudomonadota bacterium]